MTNTILSWDNTYYREIYSRQLKDNPLYWDADLNCWVAYSYELCKAILLCEDSHVPEPVIQCDSLLNKKARLLSGNLARINNGRQHDGSRQSALAVYHRIQSVNISDILRSILNEIEGHIEFDWVSLVCKRLPLLIILKGLGIGNSECAFVIENISSLVKIMSPNKTDGDIAEVNRVIDEFYFISEGYIKSAISDNLLTTTDNNKQKAFELFVCNLLGLLIQSYDAGRGVLTNTLLSLVNCLNKKLPVDEVSLKRMITETLRFAPPVHNTRRIAVKDIFIGNELIKTGQTILVVVAAANLDPAVFDDPLVYEPGRHNNEQHLTFGFGVHNCLARHLMINMALETCNFLLDSYKNIAIPPQQIKFEPLLNLRLVKKLMINLSQTSIETNYLPLYFLASQMR